MITVERAQEIWAARGPQNTIDVTEAEDKIIKERWAQMLSVHCSYMDAFFTFLHPVPIDKPANDIEKRASIWNRHLERLSKYD